MTISHQHGRKPMLAQEALRGARLTAAQLQPLPAGTPGAATAAALGFPDPGRNFALDVFGDWGGIQTPTPQLAVMHAAAQHAQGIPPAFAGHLGDNVYYGSALDQWAPQFGEPTERYPYPILAWPGNHDDQYGGDPPYDSARSTLDNWLAYFCSKSPAIPVWDPQFEFGRKTQTQPYCDWTLDLAGLTWTGAWSNVPSGGHLYDSQVQWLIEEIGNAPADRPLFLTLHHPPLSIDSHHGGSLAMVNLLTVVFQAANRVPDLCLFGHVHNFQHFSWTIPKVGTTSVVVVGNSGYHNLHPIALDYSPGMTVVPGVVCHFADASQYGFLRLAIDGTAVGGTYVGVKPGVMADGSDATFQEVYKF